jgi:beta-glucosidase
MKLRLILFTAMASFACTPPEEQLASTSDRSAWIEATLDALTLEQKVGEMTQLTLGFMLEGDDPFEPIEPQRLDPQKVTEAVEAYHIGSVLNCGDHAHTLEHWRTIVSGLQKAAAQRTPYTPILYGVDAVHGANYTTGAALGPQQIGQAATWNPEIVQALAAGTATEIHAAGTPWNFAPILDVGRDPRWPRFWETFGEDPLLVSAMGVASIQGMQEGEVPVAATMKHFLGYSQPLSGKDRTPAWIPERQLREIFLPPFQAGVDAGVMTVMVNSGEMNGIPVHADRAILTDLLRDEMGFDGLVVTDWEDIKYLVTRHKVAADYKEAVELALNAGIDMSMVPLDLEFPKLVRELVREGRISEERIDTSVRRILRVKWDLGLVEQPGPPAQHAVDETWRAAQRKLAQLAAEQSITLLKNNDAVLPLKSGEGIWVTGPTSASLAALNGGWTGTWQGTNPEFDTPGAVSALEALSAQWDAPVAHFPLGMEFTEVDIERAVKDLESQERPQAAVVFLGEMPYTELVGNDEEVDLAANQTALVQSLSRTGVPVIGVYLGGRPRRMEAAIEALDGFVMAYLPGNEGGAAIARILNGTVNPSGHLPFTWPRKSGTHLTYDHKHTERIHTDFSLSAFRPQFTFGSGLNYSQVEVVNLSVSGETFGLSDSVEVSATLHNTGSRDAEDVVLLFSQDRVASITPSVDRLRAFRRVNVPAGQRVDVVFNLPIQELGFIGQDLHYVVEPGEFGLRIDTLTTTILVKP